MPNPSCVDPAGIRLSLRQAHPGFAIELDLELRATGVTALFGASGAGKTSCLRLIAGLDRGQGSLHAFGECWQDDARGTFVAPHLRSIGYVFQEASLFPHLSVRGNLAYAQKRQRSSKNALALASVLKMLGIEALLDRTFAGLSGGERQRVAIARALLSAPRLLLMDEPLAALDEPRKADVLPYIERLRDELSIPIVYVSHSLDEVTRLADTLVLLDQGRVAAQGPILELLGRIDLPLSLGDQAGVVIEAHVAEHDAEHHLTRLEFGSASLWVSRIERSLGALARARLLARDVSIAIQQPAPSSILNVLPARIVALSDHGPDRVNVRLAVGNDDTIVLSRITRRSRDLLRLRAGARVFAQVKTVALVT
ncbi:MAG: molybdenum ABC transporter ATP-binding protein [Myxococcota bacterium]